MIKLLEWTQSERHDIATYILKTAGLTLAGAFLIGAAVSALFPNAMQPDVGDVTLQPWLVFFGVVILSPIIETLMMWLIIALLGWLFRKKSTYLIAVLSAGVWAGLHSLAAPIWGLVIFWPFVMFSLCFINWQKRSVWLAIGMTTICHAIHNFVPFLAMLAQPYFPAPAA